MPNAETHLTAACDLLADPDIVRAFPWLAGDACCAAFLMGSVSPDVRIIGGQTREETHFFTIPPNDLRAASEVMCTEWPLIGDAAKLSPPHAAFIAGYMTHLVMDQTWVEMIVMPGLFIAGESWGLSHPNWRLYCILMTWLEYRAGARLPDGSTGRMVCASPDAWLPFVDDADLVAWRDRVARLIDEGGPQQVSSLLSQSCGLSPLDMEAIVTSEETMSHEAYRTVSLAQLTAFEAETAQRSRAQVMRYLAGTAARLS